MYCANPNLEPLTIQLALHIDFITETSRSKLFFKLPGQTGAETILVDSRVCRPEGPSDLLWPDWSLCSDAIRRIVVSLSFSLGRCMIGTRHCVVNFELAIFIQNDKVEGATIVFTRNLIQNLGTFVKFSSP